MARPWDTLERVTRPEGELALRRRGERDFLIAIDNRVLMTSTAHRSEQALAECACLELATAPRPRVLLGGLGMAYTLRAALDLLPSTAELVVCEIEPAVVRWCRGPLAPLTAAATEDPRVRVREEDVGAAIVRAARPKARAFDAIALDLFEGPRGTRSEVDHPLYGDAALRRMRRALRPGGVLALWSEEPARGFERRAVAAGFSLDVRRVGRGGRRHVVYGLHPRRGPGASTAQRGVSKRRQGR